MSAYNKKIISISSIQKTAYFVPPVLEWQPLKRGFNSSVRIACIVDDNLYDGLRFEGHVLPMTESNWKSILEYGSPDFLLMNSFIESATGDWHMAQFGGLEGNGLLAKVLDYAKSRQIPTVYWFTKDHKYHEHFKNIAGLCDFIFCADPEEINLLSSEGVRSELLLPCVQPALFNPFRHYEDYLSLDIELLVDGWADLDRYSGQFKQLHSLVEDGLLKIIESNYVITKNRVKASAEYRKATLGYVSSRIKKTILKYAKVYLGLTPSIQDETERMWSYLAVAASRVCILHMGSTLRHPVMNALVLRIEGMDELMTNLRWFELDPLMREKYAHLAWREAISNHTFSHRVKQICTAISVDDDWNEYPKASLIFPTYRPDYLERCVETYQRQLYENKELMLVFNSDESIPPAIQEKMIAIPGAVILKMPRNCFAGDCINYGVLSSKGEYVFRVDDDDYYSEHYIWDRMLCHRAVSLDFLANPHSLFFYFDEDNKVFLRKTKSPPFALNPPDETPVKFTGNTYSGTRQLFENSPFIVNNYSAADVFFLDNLPSGSLSGSADYFNMAAERRSDQATHTWRVEFQSKLRSGEPLFRHFECVTC